jgi:HEPN domain
MSATTTMNENRGAQQNAVADIEEINRRFEQHSIGYQFENRQIIRVDSKMTHAEIIKPALVLLTAPEFSKANEDFMAAHRHYRANEFKDCVTAANRAFESMLKAICDTEKWEYEKGDSAAQLVKKVKAKGLFTHDFDRSFDAYVAMLKAGLPAVRNEAGGHGEGLMSAAVTAGIARFAINLTATNLVFLGDSYNAMRRRR